MSAFFIFDHRGTKDQAGVDRYVREAPPTVAAFGGTYRVIWGKHQVLEGDWQPRSLILIEFPTLAQAEAWYKSDAYRELKALRLASTEGSGVLVDGLPKMPWFVRMFPWLFKGGPPK